MSHLLAAATPRNPADQTSAALQRLADSCARFVSLSTMQPFCPVRHFHRVVSHVHDMCDALTEAEEAGACRDCLRDAVREARTVHAQSPFVRRLQEWPRGYPGDFETIEWLWQGNNHAVPDTFGAALERYAMSAAIAQQHRNKVLLQSACIDRAIRVTPSARVLSLGAGGSLDIRLLTPPIPADVRFTLCDSDPDALAFSHAMLRELGDQCRLAVGLVPKVLRRVRVDGAFHVVVAGGLFDYLPDRFIVRTLQHVWHHLLAPGGLLMFTNMAPGNPFRVWLEYFADWQLIERSGEDLRQLCAAAKIPVEPSLVHDGTGLAVVATVRKPVT